jgi:sulfatase maturation enzyme AslB (radical SAM superfamily)
MTKQTLKQKIPIRFIGKVTDNWVNGVKEWHIHNAIPGLYTLDIEHIPDELVRAHNDSTKQENIEEIYSAKLCQHKCKTCFNEEKGLYNQFVYGIYKQLVLDKIGRPKINRIMTLEDTLKVVDQAIEIAREEGHDFRSVKFLGPGELLMNLQLFQIIEEYQKRNIQFNIFTKGALIGNDELAQKYQGMSAKQLTNKLASYNNVGLLMSFQSFNDELQDNLVTSRDEKGSIIGLQGYSKIREQALVNIFDSNFYKNGLTNRICMINAPIIPENIEESFDIYKFFIERATPIVMTPSMLSGKGCGAYRITEEEKMEFQDKLVELYAKIYSYNVEKGVQTDEQIKREGIASYVGAEPCNQVATGLYLRANGIVQMCPGRFDKETVFANVQDTPLKEIWQNSFNRKMGILNPQNLINNKCLAKDGYAFPKDFYIQVMKRYEEIKM